MLINVTANGQTATATVTAPPTVGAFLNSHGAAYGANANTVVKVNGVERDNNYRIQDGDRVELTQRTSSKAAAFTISVQSNGQTQQHTLDTNISASALLRDGSFSAAYGLNANSVATVNGGAKSADSPLTQGDRVVFTQRTSSKA